jgi:hypothetical protein
VPWVCKYSFAYFYNPIFTFLDPTEIFPLAIRAKGNAFGIVGRYISAGINSANSLGWSIGCGSVSLAAPNMFQSLGPSTFYIHAVFNLFAILIVYCFYPETSCRTLEEVWIPLQKEKSSNSFRSTYYSPVIRFGSGIQRKDSKNSNWNILISCMVLSGNRRTLGLLSLLRISVRRIRFKGQSLSRRTLVA